MEIFWRLVFGHLIADFTLQTNFIAKWKRKNIWGVVVHSLIHPLIYTLLLMHYLSAVWMQIGRVSLHGYTCLLIIFTLHFIEDEWRVLSVQKKSTADNTFFYVWDQSIHYLTLFIFSPALASVLSHFTLFYFPEIPDILHPIHLPSLDVFEMFFYIVEGNNQPWIFIGILSVIVTHFATVTIYFLEKEKLGAKFPAPLEKYLAMGERAVVFLGFLIPGKWGILIAGIWLGKILWGKLRQHSTLSWIHLGVGYGLSIVCGILGRILLY